MVIDIMSADIPDGRAAMQISVTGPGGATRLIPLSHLGLVLLAAAGQRGDGTLIAPINLHATMTGRIAEEITMLVRQGLAEQRDASAARISVLGRAVLDAVEDED